MPYVSKQQIREARKADLYEFLLSHHPGAVVREGDSLRPRCNRSISIRRGYSGYKDFASGETGNSIEFLQRYLNYEFADAVASLQDHFHLPDIAYHEMQRDKHPEWQQKNDEKIEFALPAHAEGRYRQLYAYLQQTRGIPAEMIQWLIDRRILYQSADHANMVFVNPARTFYEVRGSNSYRPFHQTRFAAGKEADFWWFRPVPTKPATMAYICEGAIDAISLYLLHVHTGENKGENPLYVAIAGVDNQQRIDAVKARLTPARTYIAVDNDAAGQRCRERNSDCPSIYPTNCKDWNEAWKHYVQNT